MHTDPHIYNTYNTIFTELSLFANSLSNPICFSVYLL